MVFILKRIVLIQFKKVRNCFYLIIQLQKNHLCSIYYVLSIKSLTKQFNELMRIRMYLIKII